VGKSTLTDRLIHFLRQGAKPVAWWRLTPPALFPAAPILGDRNPGCSAHALDEGVFIRSLATRDISAGLTASARA